MIESIQEPGRIFSAISKEYRATFHGMGIGLMFEL